MVTLAPPRDPDTVSRHTAPVLHVLLALANMALLAGHVYLATLNPAMRHSL